MRGVDGHGWIGTDKHGNRVYKSDAEMEAERLQEIADARRTEALYVSEEYKVFFLTKQAGLKDDDRNAYISIKPFCTLSDAKIDTMKAKALAWDEASSNVAITVKDPLVVFHDKITNTDSSVYIGELDTDVRAKLRFNQAAASAWEKYEADPAATAAPVAISHPLTFRTRGLAI